ncbi:Dihydrodipicolinate synthase [Rhodovastum atsumiense]|uniref:Dihydrodipicolinate synthase family protein n=1 Tax=Rhodovastum atsumiense TaxID=504468 RepID=A0A5M6IVE8_9PROT|nr:dihydrodipicolinate synthase family protein [Rhodovastum atsumiense]KAA5611385.1 dihydrodipicolinate synthase family protein [Rhodovastum atsumiense]CAH2603608.1 Dihydrodipicolinate synthase [Rhodovastum atsumiense]
MKTVRGICPAMLTVWGKDEAFNPKGQEAYIRWLLDNGVEALAVAGSTGEMTAMMNEEQEAVIDHAVRFVAGQVPVLASVGKYSTVETLRLARSAAKSGADGLMVILPYYYKPYKEAAIRHLKTIRKEVGLPICLYNNPHFAGYEMTPRDIVSLYQDDVVFSVKAAHGDANRVADLRTLSDITIFYGHDYAPLAAYASGADGWLSGLPAAFPKQCRAMQDAVRDEKNLDKGRALWKKFQPFIEFFMDPAVNAEMHWLEMLKHCVAYQGVDVGRPRSPLVALPEPFKARLNPLIDTLVS